MFFQSSWFVLAFMLTSAAMILTFGRISDMIGRRQVYISGLASFTQQCRCHGAAAQKALDALAAGGFHGTTDSKDLKIKDDSGAPKGKVKTLTLEGVHNCCGKCNTGITGAVGKVAGVTGNTAKAKTDTFEVTGEFDAEELIKALNAAGYHVKVKK